MTKPIPADDDAPDDRLDEVMREMAKIFRDIAEAEPVAREKLGEME